MISITTGFISWASISGVPRAGVAQLGLILARHFSELVKGVLSHRETAGQERERVYHAFPLGILVSLRGEYRVSSNRESGFGRYQAALIPEHPSKTGFIFKFKRKGEQTPARTAKAALEQIVARDYVAAGVSRILAIGDKQVWINSQCLTRS